MWNCGIFSNSITFCGCSSDVYSSRLFLLVEFWGGSLDGVERWWRRWWIGEETFAFSVPVPVACVGVLRLEGLNFERLVDSEG